MTARFLSVAEGNISRLRDAQAFHAAVKWPPYFTFARQRRHFTAGHNLPGFLWGAEQKKRTRYRESVFCYR